MVVVVVWWLFHSELRPKNQRVMVVVSIYPFTKLCQSLVGGFNAVQKNKSQHGNLPQVGVKIWNHNQELEHLRKFRVTGNKHLFQLTLMFCQQHVNPATSILGFKSLTSTSVAYFYRPLFPKKTKHQNASKIGTLNERITPLGYICHKRSRELPKN